MTAAVRDPVAQAKHDAVVIRESLDEPDRFGAIFEAYYQEIHAYLARRLGPGSAPDIAAETFLHAFRKRHRYDANKASARTWLYGFATKLVAKHRRTEERALRALGRLSPSNSAEGPEERVTAQVSSEGLRGRLTAALADLSAGDRDVVLLVALGELSHEEVAAALGIPYGTVGSRLNRARRKLRTALGETNPLLEMGNHDG